MEVCPMWPRKAGSFDINIVQANEDKGLGEYH